MKKFSLQGVQRSLPGKINYAEHLNSQQLEAVTAENGPILVIAGAGSGKTRTITYRVAWLLDNKILPERIMLVTFTNKAARDMLHRLEHLISSETRRIWGGTFHHIGNLILRRHAHLLGYTNNYTILDRADSMDLFELCMSDRKIDVKKRRFPTARILSDICSLRVNTERDVEKIMEDKYSFFVQELEDVERIITRYKEKKKQLNVMDFDDLLFNWKKLFIEFPEVEIFYAQNFCHILVDEYQDTNKLQGEIVERMASVHRNIMVVGDDSQSIYSFRGANFANIIDFTKRYPDAKLFKLEINYRSTSQILQLTNFIIAANTRQFPKSLKALKEGSFKPAVVPSRDVNQQAEFVAEKILEIRDEGRSLKDIAILYRSHYHCMEIQMELVRRGIPFVIRSGLRFFERTHIKDVVAYLKISVNPRDELSWKRLFKMLPGIGDVTAHRLWKDLSSSDDPLQRVRSKEILSVFTRKTSPAWSDFSELFAFLQDKSLHKNPAPIIQIILQQGYSDYLKSKFPDYEERIEDLSQLATFARNFSSVRNFLSDLALLGSVESETVVAGGDDDESVVLSTVHQAKGLEWSVIFIIWLADGRFPAAKALKDLASLEEERRLLYVAATRAKEELYLCYPIIAGNWRQAMIMKSSRFLRELDKEVYDTWIISDEIELLLHRLEREEALPD